MQAILKLSLDDAADGVDDEKLKKFCQNILKYSVKTGHRHFYIQLYGGTDYYGLAGSWITDALNTSQYTFEVAPALILVEQEVLKKTTKLFGYPEETDGILCPGGSISNMYGLVLARYKAFPNIKEDGMAALPRLALFASEDSHYSLLKLSNWLGIGTKNLIKVRSDDEGRMIPEQLEVELKKAVAEGMTPFFVNATAGTTVLGAFDPFEEIADICKKYGVWMHVDACWGGSLKFSEKYGTVLKGIERSDSLAWNPHKLLGAPLQCSIFLVRHKGLMHACNSAAANYLFQQDKFYDVSYDIGDKSVQCGRKDDAFKLWLMWKARGDNGLTKLVDNAMSVSDYLRNKMASRPGFEMVTKTKPLTNVCFYYIPSNMRNQERTEEWWNKISEVAPKVKEQLILNGIAVIAYNPITHRNLKNLFRLVLTCHPPPKTADMDYIIGQIEKYAENL
ncbi:acidic amino acid decarboxylase GADL1 isoform X2 [Arctopsyche grandis]|uniref:acidic amino acid decarboxylase GADL1 isoform X2 n=1 Tax=Arctopsyche grandis TaxID=121162 RepID=UPI00406D751C